MSYHIPSATRLCLNPVKYDYVQLMHMPIGVNIRRLGDVSSARDGETLTTVTMTAARLSYPITVVF